MNIFDTKLSSWLSNNWFEKTKERLINQWSWCLRHPQLVTVTARSHGSAPVRLLVPYLALLGLVTNWHLDKRIWVAVYFLPWLSKNKKQIKINKHILKWGSLKMGLLAYINSHFYLLLILQLQGVSRHNLTGKQLIANTPQSHTCIYIK